jgi:hypothetical protein
MQGGQVFLGVKFVGLLGGIGIELGIADRFCEAVEACPRTGKVVMSPL